VRYCQLLLFPRPPRTPEPLRHRWQWHPVWPSECSRCFALWPPGASVTEMTTQECPGPVLDTGFNDYSDPEIVYLG
jgi:hypothetical protein